MVLFQTAGWFQWPGKKTKTPTIKDVAAAAGVSTSTVGRVLGGYGYASPETRRRVMKAAKQLGYRPNAIARSLKTKQSRIIGFFLSSITNLFHARIAEGLQEVASSYGYNVVICCTGLNANRASAFGQMLLESQAAGVVFSVPGDEAVIRVAQSLLDNDIPVVTCHGSIRIPSQDRIVCDDFQGGYLAAKHLVELGHQRIGIIGVKDSGTSARRIQGAASFLKEHGIVPSRVSIVEVVSYSTESGYTGVKLLSARDEKPSAIIAANDLMALGVLECLEEMELRVPEDVSVIGFDDSFAEMTRPRLTTVALPMYEAGQVAAQLLLERIEGKDVGEERFITLPERLVVRESTTVYR